MIEEKKKKNRKKRFFDQLKYKYRKHKLQIDGDAQKLTVSFGRAQNESKNRRTQANGK